MRGEVEGVAAGELGAGAGVGAGEGPGPTPTLFAKPSHFHQNFQELPFPHLVLYVVGLLCMRRGKALA